MRVKWTKWMRVNQQWKRVRNPAIRQDQTEFTNSPMHPLQQYLCQAPSQCLSFTNPLDLKVQCCQRPFTSWVLIDHESPQVNHFISRWSTIVWRHNKHYNYWLTIINNHSSFLMILNHDISQPFSAIIHLSCSSQPSSLSPSQNRCSTYLWFGRVCTWGRFPTQCNTICAEKWKESGFQACQWWLICWSSQSRWAGELWKSDSWMT